MTGDVIRPRQYIPARLTGFSPPLVDLTVIVRWARVLDVTWENGGNPYEQ